MGIAFALKTSRKTSWWYFATLFVAVLVSACAPRPPEILPSAALPSEPQLTTALPAPDLTVPAFSFKLPERRASASLQPKPAGLVVPHHLLAAELMADAYFRVAASAYQQVIIISPDHFAQGNGNIHWAAVSSQTEYGTVPAGEVPEALRKFPIFTPKQVSREHGLALHLPFIARYLSGTPVLLVAVREGTDAKTLEAVAGTLRSTSTLAVLSLDFSHELPPQWAAYHDRAAITALSEADPAGVASLEVDNRSALELFLRLMQKQGTQRFQLLENKNGDQINPAARYATVTSYVTGMYTAGAVQPIAGLSLTFTGDVMLDRKVYANGKRVGTLDYPFQNIARVLSGDDFSVINHEGPMTERTYHASPTDPNNVTFNFDPAYRPFLRGANIEVFGLANNHTLNMGTDGLATTRTLLTESGGRVVGDPRSVLEPMTLSAHGWSAAITAIYDTLQTDYDAVEKILQGVPTTTFSVAFMHWGNEYQRAFSKRQAAIAHGLIDAGADLVVGAGPHVLQPVEVYQEKAIFYSLGNFIFDQDWSVATQQGAALGVRLEDNDVAYTLLPVAMRGGQVRIAEPAIASTTLQFFSDTFVGPQHLGRSLQQGKMVLSNRE